MHRRVLLIQFCLGAFLLASLPQVAVAAGQAVVSGANSLHVRSGAGREYPALGVLQEGDVVGIETTEGSWVRVRLSNGQTGYVHKAFLVPVERQEEGGPMVGADDVPVAKSDAPVAQGAEPAEIVPAEPAARAEAAPNNEENDQPRSGDEPSGKEPLERVVESLQAEVGRLLEVTGKIQGGSVGAEPTPTPVWGDIAAVDATESGSLLGVSIVSLVAGFALGAIYGRRQERGRRTRVRF